MIPFNQPPLEVSEEEQKKFYTGPTELFIRHIWDTWYGPGSSIHMGNKCAIHKSFEIHLAQHFERMKAHIESVKKDRFIAELLRDIYVAKLENLQKELRNKRNVEQLINVEDENIELRNDILSGHEATNKSTQTWTAVDEGYMIGINEAIKAIKDVTFHYTQ